MQAGQILKQERDQLQQLMGHLRCDYESVERAKVAQQEELMALKDRMKKKGRREQQDARQGAPQLRRACSHLSGLHCRGLCVLVQQLRAHESVLLLLCCAVRVFRVSTVRRHLEQNSSLCRRKLCGLVAATVHWP